MEELLNRILLGDNAFIGVNHLSQERARDTLARLNSEKIARVMRTAFLNGADGFVFSTHPTNIASLQLLKVESPELAFGIYPLLPYAQGYVRIMNEKGTVALFTEFMQKLSVGGKFRALMGGGLSALTMNPYKLLSTFVDAEVDSVIRSANENCKLESIFLHEIIVDLGVALQLKELFQSFISHINDSFHVKAGLVTRNLPLLVKYLNSIDQNPRDVVMMTPFNSLGFQMNPSKEECEKVLVDNPDYDIIAMGVLAGGLISLRDAADYIGNLSKIKSAVIGVSREEQAKVTFNEFRNAR